MLKKCALCGREEYILSWQEVCFVCRENSRKNKLCEEIQSGERTSVECESVIICPWCGEEYETSDDYEMYAEGDHNATCCRCEREFGVYTTVNYSFDTERIDKVTP